MTPTAAPDGPGTPLPLAPIAGCALDAEGVARQRARYRELGGHVVALRRRPARLTIELAPTAPRALVEEVIATERACCPFFSIALDPSGRRLTVAVSEDAHQPALHAIAFALGAEGDSGV